MAGNWYAVQRIPLPPSFFIGGGWGRGKKGKYVLARNKKILVILPFLNLIWDKILEIGLHESTYFFVAAGLMEKHSLILFVARHPGLELHQEECRRKMLVYNFLEFPHHFSILSV